MRTIMNGSVSGRTLNGWLVQCGSRDMCTNKSKCYMNKILLNKPGMLVDIQSCNTDCFNFLISNAYLIEYCLFRLILAILISIFFVS